MIFSHKLIAAIAILYVGCFVLFATDVHADEVTDSHKNFVIILVDDLGWTDLGCFGSPFYETPHIDALAASGMRFTNGYAACPVCSPTRASLQTGKNPARLQTTNYFGGPQPEQITEPRFEKRFRNRRLLPAPYVDRLPLAEQTLAELLSTRGYATYFAGKWHLGGSGFYPEDQGYQHNLGGHLAGSPPGGYFSPYRNPKLDDGPAGEHLPNRLAKETIQFLRTTGDQPFLAVLSFYSVHIPLQGRDDLVTKYQIKAKHNQHSGPKYLPEGKNKNRQVQDLPVYAAMVEAMDDAVGQVLRTLDELQLADDTVVIFTSDNGGLSTSEGTPTSNLPLRAGKGWLYEGGIRVPWIVRWPEVTAAGSVSSQPITTHDVLPTIMEIAAPEVALPTSLDGMSLVPLLRDASQTTERTLYWHYPHYGNQGGSPGGAIRSGDWKLIEWYEDQRLELFNLATDVGEQLNLAQQQPEKTKRLHEQLIAWKKSVGAIMPTANPNYVSK